jgi:septum formation protein
MKRDGQTQTIMPQPRIILASASARRQELLRSLGLDFEISPSGIDEAQRKGESPEKYALRMARDKAVEVAPRHTDGIVIAADTVVVIDDQILGKPADRRQARSMLSQLSGRWHTILTAVWLIAPASGQKASGIEQTRVKFARLRRTEIDWYLSTGEFGDKAGAYAIQGYGSLLVEQIEGDYFNVVGLPLRLLYKLAARLGVDLKHKIKQNQQASGPKEA